MNIANDTTPVNYVDYFTKQLPVDLANMAALRDELEKRQGAMNAVEASLADRAKAAEELAAARAEADALLADAKKTAADARDAAGTLVADAKAADAKSKAKAADLAEREKAVAAAEAAVSQREAAADKREAENASVAAWLAEDRTALDARIKDFQAKVASITA